jgi:DNA-binding MarR family transcriptional regulator
MLRHDEMLCYWLGVALRRVQRRFTEALEQYEITPAQLFVLNCLESQDGLKPRQLAEQVALDASSLTGLLDRMERSGYVERKADPHDRRSLRVLLTDLGRSRLAELGPLVLEEQQRMMQDFFAGYSEEQVELFWNMLRHMGRTEAERGCAELVR